jgi:hypothetical protein
LFWRCASHYRNGNYADDESGIHVKLFLPSLRVSFIMHMVSSL